MKGLETGLSERPKNLRIIRFWVLLATVLVLATACPEIDPEPIDPEPDTAYTQLLTTYESWIDYKPWQVRSVSDENLTGPGGNFQYWWEHRTEANGALELWAMCALSNEQLSTMSTRNLARTVYLYPYGMEYEAFDNPYLGILLEMGRFNGTRELMQRKSGASELLHLYTEVHYPHTGNDSFYIPLDYTEYLNEGTFLPRITYLTFLLVTAVDYGCFSSGEVRILATAVEDKIVDILSDPHGTYSWAGSTRYPYILGAWTAYRYDQKLSEDQRNTLRRFFDPLYNVLKAPGMPYLMDPEKQEWVMDKQLINDASQIFFESLERLKQ